jgi:hypothetical protein
MRKTASMVLIVVSVLGVVIAALLIAAVMKPNQFRIARTVDVAAAPQVVFDLINDLHNWSRWHPQRLEGSGVAQSFSGAQAGVGACSEWKGSGDIGQGRMCIAQSTAPARIVIEADWEKPFVTRNINEFALSADGGQTAVIWSMSGPNLFIMKAMSIFVDMDRMMGRHFEQGLVALKRVAESAVR